MVSSSTAITVEDIGGVYLNALKITLSSPEVHVIEIETKEDIYSEHVKPWLDKNNYIAYWTPRRRSGSKNIYTSYITSVGSSIDDARSRLDELRDKISVKGDTRLAIKNESIKILENAIMKRFIIAGWQCSKRPGNIGCLLPAPLSKTSTFSFYRSIEFRVTYIGTPLLVIKPRLSIEGSSLRELLKEFGENALQMVINRECIAMHRREGRYRSATVLGVRGIDVDRYLVKVVFYDGFEDEVDIDSARLAGNVLLYKELLTGLLGEQRYRQLEEMQRTYSFSLGPKESSLQLARDFRDEILRILKMARDAGAFPFQLGDTRVDIEQEFFKVV